MRCWWARSALWLSILSLFLCLPRAPAQEKILHALEQRVEVQCENVPLQDLTDLIAQLGHFSVVYDHKSLDDVGAQADWSITCRAKGLKLRRALELALARYDFTWCIEDEALCIVGNEQEETLAQTRVYDVADLVTRNGSPSRASRDFSPLIELITRTIRPASWRHHGGRGRLASFEASGVATLTARNCREVLDAIDGLLAKLRSLRPAGPRPASAAPATLPSLGPALGSQQKNWRGKAFEWSFGPWLRALPEPAVLPDEQIRRALDQPVAMEFVAAPLPVVVDRLKQILNAHVELDTIRLHEADIPPDCLLTFRQQGLRLRTALTQLLHPYGMTWLVRDEVLLITTPAGASRLPLLEVYAVADLVAAVDREGRACNDFDSLINVIDRTIWGPPGGAAAIVPFEAPGITAIVVSQGREVHERLARLLDGLREQRRPGANSAPPVKERTPKSVVPLNWICPEASGFVP